MHIVALCNFETSGQSNVLYVNCMVLLSMSYGNLRLSMTRAGAVLLASVHGLIKMFPQKYVTATLAFYVAIVIYTHCYDRFFITMLWIGGEPPTESTLKMIHGSR